MVKEYCDICGKKAKTTKYVLPFRYKEKANDKFNNTILCFNVVKPTEVDLCTSCACDINSLICYDIKQVLDRHK